MKKVFKRFECKYLITKAEAKDLEKLVSENVSKDEYPNCTIQSLYYDTPTYQLIRTSIEKPDYKEKLRIRTYTVPSEDTEVFVELKKKVNKIVYKRRIIMKYQEAIDYFNNDTLLDGQIGKEINYFKSFYKNLQPSFLIIYDRNAYCDTEKDLRITFDFNIRFRTDNLSLSEKPTGKLILDEGKVLMEIKTCMGYPKWLCDYLSGHQMYKTSFSKYGTAYKKLILGGKQ